VTHLFEVDKSRLLEKRALGYNFSPCLTSAVFVQLMPVV
jgi:hypothetical protein